MNAAKEGHWHVLANIGLKGSLHLLSAQLVKPLAQSVLDHTLQLCDRVRQSRDALAGQVDRTAGVFERVESADPITTTAKLDLDAVVARLRVASQAP